MRRRCWTVFSSYSDWLITSSRNQQRRSIERSSRQFPKYRVLSSVLEYVFQLCSLLSALHKPMLNTSYMKEMTSNFSWRARDWQRRHLSQSSINSWTTSKRRSSTSCKNRKLSIRQKWRRNRTSRKRWSSSLSMMRKKSHFMRWLHRKRIRSSQALDRVDEVSTFLREDEAERGKIKLKEFVRHLWARTHKAE